MIYFNKREGPTNKVRKMDAINGDNTKMTDKVVYKSVCSTTSQLRSKIQSIQSQFKLIRFNDNR